MSSLTSNQCKILVSLNAKDVRQQSVHSCNLVILSCHFTHPDNCLYWKSIWALCWLLYSPHFPHFCLIDALGSASDSKEHHQALKLFRQRHIKLPPNTIPATTNVFHKVREKFPPIFTMRQIQERRTNSLYSMPELHIMVPKRQRCSSFTDTTSISFPLAFVNWLVHKSVKLQNCKSFKGLRTEKEKKKKEKTEISVLEKN